MVIKITDLFISLKALLLLFKKYKGINTFLDSKPVSFKIKKI